MTDCDAWPRAHKNQAKMPRQRTVPAAQRRAILATILYMVQCATLAVSLYASQWYWKQPYHTSALSGAEWVEELIYGHPKRIKSCLGMCYELLAEFYFLFFSYLIFSYLFRSHRTFMCTITHEARLIFPMTFLYLTTFRSLS